jgi:hypothetical protein
MKSIKEVNMLNKWPKPYLKANFRVIEQDLYTYKLMKQTVTEKLEELDQANSFEPGLKATRINELYINDKPKNENKQYQEAHSTVRNESNPTQDQAFMAIHWEQRKKYLSTLLAGTQYAEMQRRVEAIDYVLKRLDNSFLGYEKSQAALIRERYFEHQLTPDGLAAKFNISRATVYRWSEDVIQEIAIRLGFLI